MQTQLIIWMQHLFSDDCQARTLSQQTGKAKSVCIYRIIVGLKYVPSECGLHRKRQLMSKVFENVYIS